MRKEKEKSLRIGGRDLSLWFDVEEKVWKAQVLELKEGKWIELWVAQSVNKEDLESLFKDSIAAARAIVSKEAYGEKEAVGHS